MPNTTVACTELQCLVALTEIPLTTLILLYIIVYSLKLDLVDFTETSVFETTHNFRKLKNSSRYLNLVDVLCYLFLNLT